MQTINSREFLDRQAQSKFPHTGPVYYFGRRPYGAALKGQLLHAKDASTRWFKTEAGAIAAINKAAREG